MAENRRESSRWPSASQMREGSFRPERDLETANREPTFHAAALGMVLLIKVSSRVRFCAQACRLSALAGRCVVEAV